MQGRSGITAATAALVLVMVAGCANSAKVPRPAPESAPAQSLPADAHVTPAFESIARLAMSQGRRPISGIAEPTPPGLDPVLAATAGRSVDDRPTATLDAVLRELAQAPPAVRELSVSDDAEAAALRKYIAGRELLLAGKASEAVPELRAASELDPSSGAILRELGEAYAAMGRRADAAVAFERAVARGLEDARALELLARSAMERADAEGAARLLARAAAASPQRLDPLLPHVILIQLSRALMETGRHAAAREALFKSFEDAPTTLSASTRYAPDFGAFIRRQGELMREAGDASLRLGRYGDAVDDYARAAALPVMDGVSIAPRLVYASQRAGRPALAALYLLEGIAARGGRASDEEVAILGHVARLPGMASPLSRALDSYRASLESGKGSPSVVRNLTRAQAAVIGGDAMRSVLRAHLSRYPGDVDAATDLLNTLPDASAVVKEAAALTASHPMSVGAIAEACLRSVAGVPEIDSFPRSAEGRLLAALVCAAQGRPAAGLEVLSAVSTTGTLGIAADLWRGELGLGSGKPELAEQALARLLAGKSEDHTRAAAALLSSQQRVSEALVLARGLVEGAEPRTPAQAAHRITDLLLCADLSLRAGESGRAEDDLKAAMALDPMDDRPRARLIELYVERGDQARFNEAARDLRQDLPDSRAIRSLRAHELARRGMLAQAEQEALRLASEEIADPAPMRLLVQVWEQQAKQEPEVAGRAMAWVRARLERRPQSSTLLAAQTMLLLLEENPAEAERRLSAALEAGAGPDVARMRENLLRESLGRADEARRQALARLENRTRTVAEAIELAAEYARAGRTSDALKAARASITPEITLTAEQRAQVAVLGVELAALGAQSNDRDAIGAGAWFLDEAAARGATLTPDMHKVRLVALAMLPDVAVQRLIKAVGDASAQHPSLGPVPTLRVSQVLEGSGRAKDALALLKATIADGQGTPELWIEWTRVVAARGGAAEVRELIEASDRAGAISTILQRIRGGEGGIVQPKAELAYIAGNLMASFDRGREAEAAYELALEYQPDHAWAANNLGYSLVERGVDLERAGELLERAHAAMPDEGAITDSLGWLRYKQGIFEDELGEHGVVKQRGAVSLLQSAAMSEHGKDDPTVLDHLADALWCAGRVPEAQRYWQLAENYARRSLAEQASSESAPGEGSAGGLADAAAAEYKNIIRATRTKLKAASEGTEVPVAKRFAPAPAAGPSSARRPADAPTPTPN